jgi:hypothetical protein
VTIPITIGAPKPGEQTGRPRNDDGPPKREAIFIVLAVISLVVALWSGPRWLFLLYRQRPADAASKQDFAETIVQRLTQRHL